MLVRRHCAVYSACVVGTWPLSFPPRRYRAVWRVAFPCIALRLVEVFSLPVFFRRRHGMSNWSVLSRVTVCTQLTSLGSWSIVSKRQALAMLILLDQDIKNKEEDIPCKLCLRFVIKFYNLVCIVR